jgi:plasmid stabilization system protein ParE
MAELKWTVEAERWLRDIYEFIARDNPPAASRTVQTIL